MKKILFSIVFVLLANQVIKAQDYFPLQIGNKFIYSYQIHYYWPGGGHSVIYGFRLMKILDTTKFQNKKYYYCQGSPTFNNRWVRVDSVTKSLYSYDSTNSCQLYNYEKLIDSLGMIASGYETNCTYAQFSGIIIDTYFNVASYAITFERLTDIIFDSTRAYNSVFGLKYYSNESTNGPSGYHEYGNLIGCVINGIVYGDTTYVGIKTISTIVPDKYSLYQNYPNPFNPVTKIKFEIPSDVKREMSNVKLVIFDILGKEIRTLVNESLQSGSYEVSFDGSNLPSGVYFYLLRAGDYIETKKLVLLK